MALESFGSIDAAEAFDWDAVFENQRCQKDTKHMTQSYQRASVWVHNLEFMIVLYCLHGNTLDDPLDQITSNGDPSPLP